MVRSIGTKYLRLSNIGTSVEFLLLSTITGILSGYLSNIWSASYGLLFCDDGGGDKKGICVFIFYYT
jgi:hypothetical protein